MRMSCLLTIAAAAAVFANAAVAEPSCGAWNYQSAGVYFQICVSDDGSRHCYQATDDKGSNAKEVSCS